MFKTFAIKCPVCLVELQGYPINKLPFLMEMCLYSSTKGKTIRCSPETLELPIVACSGMALDKHWTWLQVSSGNPFFRSLDWKGPLGIDRFIHYHRKYSVKNCSLCFLYICLNIHQKHLQGIPNLLRFALWYCVSNMTFRWFPNGNA